LGIGPPDLATLSLNSDGRVSTLLSDTQVLFDGVAAPLIYVSENQVAAVVPYSVAAKSATVIQVAYKGLTTNAATLSIADTAPALFSANSSGKGPGAILNEDGSVNSARSPARRGSVVMLFGTGVGQTTPAGVDGQLARGLYPKPTAPVKVQIGGQDEQILYAGAAPDMVAGMLQVNARIPDTAASGNVPVVLTVGNSSSPPVVTVAVE
jgi:uncharacterized protein (TIGR03437 family)